MRDAEGCLLADSAVELVATATPAATRSNTRVRATRLNTHWLPSEAGHDPAQALLELDLGLPAENLRCARDVRLACLRVVDGQGLEDDLASRPSHADDGFRELQDRKLVRVPEIGWQVLLAHRQEIHPVDQVVHVTETAGLGAVAENGQRLVIERLAHERRNRASVVRPHARPVRVEDPG